MIIALVGVCNETRQPSLILAKTERVPTHLSCFRFFVEKMQYNFGIHNGDCIELMQQIPDNSIDCILTDPPYLYLKNKKFDRPFDETAFFNEAKRVLKKDGFIVLFGRGTSFYRWNCILADLGFTFKEEFVWDKGYNTSPLMAISRVHETISIHTKGKGVITKVKVPYLEMKGHDIDSIVTDVKRLKGVFKNTKSLDAVLAFLENNEIEWKEPTVKHRATGGLNEKTIIRNGFCKTDKYRKYKHTVNHESAGIGDRCVSITQSIAFGQNEKSIIKENREHYNTIHPTQKPPRLIERLLALVSKKGDVILDPFSGSGATAVACFNSNRKYICFEIDKEFYDLSVERLRKHTQQGKLEFA